MKQQAVRGMSLVELMIGIAIIAMLFFFTAPSFSNWIQNTQIRTAAEAIQNGLMLARAEAVRRNTTVRFQLTSSADNTCALATSGTTWVVSMDDPSGACGNDISDTVAPRLIQLRGTSGSRNAAVAATQSTVVFNGLGRVTPVPAGDINISVSNPVGGNCATQGGNMRCLRINASPGGQVLMCDPKFPSTDPQGCPPCPLCPF